MFRDVWDVFSAMDSHARAHVREHINKYPKYPKASQEYEKCLSLLGFFEIMDFRRASHNGRLNIPPITLANLATVIFEGERDGGSN
jgi:hypothetical protein